MVIHLKAITNQLPLTGKEKKSVGWRHLKSEISQEMLFHFQIESQDVKHLSSFSKDKISLQEFFFFF